MRRHPAWLVLSCAVLLACGVPPRSDRPRPDDGGSDGGLVDDGGDPADGGDEGPCVPGVRRCQDIFTAQLCLEDDEWEDIPCATGTSCQDGLCLRRICLPGETRCNGDGRTEERCRESGTGWIETECPQPGACQGGRCVVWNCQPGQSRCATATVAESCVDDGSAWVAEPCRTGQGEGCFGGECRVPVCQPGETRCMGSATVEVCREDASGWLGASCPQPGECQEDRCVTFVCEPGTGRCAGPSTLETCAANGSGWVSSSCAPDVCLDSSCTAPVCSIGSRRCRDANTRERCFDGTGWTTEHCGEQRVCSGGECLQSICTPFARRCVNGSTAEICSEDGTSWTAQACPGDSVCTGSGTCSPRICTPGGAGCSDSTTRATCNAQGTGWSSPQPCPSGKACAGGVCVDDPCEAAASEGSPAGCRFYTTPTPNSDLSAGSSDKFALVVANPDTEEVTVTVRSPSGNSSSFTVAPRSGTSRTIDYVRPGIGSGIGTHGWLVTSTRPVVLYQSLPVELQKPAACDWLCDYVLQACNPTKTYCTFGGSFAGNAALSWIRPAHGLDATYVVPAMPHQRTTARDGSGSTDHEWAITVVSASTQTTQVTVHLRGASASGTGLSQGTPGGTLTFSLGAQQVARIVSRTFGDSPRCGDASESTQVCTWPAGDLSGSVIVADRPVAVISGASCYRVPGTEWGCDHMEEFVPPYSALGTVHVAAARSSAPLTYRVVATRNDTSVTFEPSSVAGGATLAAGGVLDVAPTVGGQPGATPFVLTTNRPVMVMRLAPGRTLHASADDPSLEILGPTAQFRSSGVFHLPSALAPMELLVVGPAGVQPALNGSPVTLQAIGASGYGYAPVSVSGGFGALQAALPIGASLIGGAVGGWSSTVSYGVSTSVVHGVKKLNADGPTLP